MTNSWPEIHRFRKIYASSLTPRERILMPLSRWANPMAWVRWRVMQPIIHYVLGPLKHRVITPIVTWGGDLLEYVPERWRPPIRTRDRIAKRRPREMQGDPRARRSPFVSPIGLEPVSNDPGPPVVEWLARRPVGERPAALEHQGAMPRP